MLVFWDLPRPPSYDETLIAIWRLYARVPQRLANYSYKCAEEANHTGMPIVRPLFLADAGAKDAWANWWTYMYGPDLVVAPIWKDGDRSVRAYLPSGSKWRDAWNPDKTYDGGQSITASAEPHQIPLYVRIGSSIDLGDLNQEWRDAVQAAHNKPDLKTLDAGVKEWFEKQSK
jgi:alpha-glucosidase (family GH31 glycosyl hydrolase)